MHRDQKETTVQSPDLIDLADIDSVLPLSNADFDLLVHEERAPTNEDLEDFYADLSGYGSVDFDATGEELRGL
jgi:hypothetical protein